MRRKMWLAVLLTTIVLAIAGIVPWMLSAPGAGTPRTAATPNAAAQRPVASPPRALPGVTPNAANDGVASRATSDGAADVSANSSAPATIARPAIPASTEGRESEESVVPRASTVPTEDQQLLAVATRGGAIGIAAAVIGIVVVWRFSARGGLRRRAISLAGRGLRTHEVARRTGMSQDAVRTLLVPDVAARRRKSAT